VLARGDPARGLGGHAAVGDAGEQGLGGDHVHDVDHPRRRAGTRDLLDGLDDLDRRPPRAPVVGADPEPQQAIAPKRLDTLGRKSAVTVDLGGM
jgi:hypothetical protein